MGSFDLLLRGMAIGFAIAAPVGPIGLLCIRRSLADGRAAGLATGLGAATADAVYGLMVAVGVSATGLLVSYARPMGLAGGALIVWLGAMALKTFWASRNAPDEADSVVPTGHRSVLTSWATTFLLTLSNPMTILAFVGMVAGLGAGAAAPGAAYLLVLGVFLGSALWWLLLVHAALFARGWMTARMMRWIDFGSGLLLVVWGGWIAGKAAIGA